MLEGLMLLIVLMVWPQLAVAIMCFMTGHPIIGIIAFFMTFASSEVRVVERVVTRHVHGPPKLTRADAFAVLGCTPTASRAAILAAYKRLIASVHPDRGGSDWLASKVNEARDLVLDKRRAA